MTTEEVAKGYGVSAKAIYSHSERHSEELINNTHYLILQNAESGQTRHMRYWTREGVIMLGFFIKSENAKIFRKWASQLILNHLEPKETGLEAQFLELQNQILQQQNTIEALEDKFVAQQAELIQNLKQDLLQATQGLVDTSIADNNLAQREQYWQYLDAVYQMLDKRLQKVEPPQITLQDASASFYLFQKQHTSEHKFGKSIQPLDRLQQIQATSGNAVELILAIQMPTEAMALELENYLKKHFKSKRIRSEWFDLNEHDVNFIRMIAQSFEIYFAQQS